MDALNKCVFQVLANSVRVINRAYESYESDSIYFYVYDRTYSAISSKVRMYYVESPKRDPSARTYN